jgi:hypothetical protein
MRCCLQEQSNLKLERSAAQWHTPPLSQVLVLLLAFSYAYLTYINKISSSKDLQLSGIRLPYHRFGPALSARAPSRYFIWLPGHYCNVRAA